MVRLRESVVVVAAAVLTVCGAGTAVAKQVGPGALRVTDLRTEHLVDPIGVDAPAPLLEWKLDAPGARLPDGQVAYQLRAASSVAALRHGHADLWDSGKVRSARQSNVPFSAVRLHSRQAVAWQVRVWTGTGRVSGWSAPATWEMGLLDRSDWSARWIENAAYDYTGPDGSETPLPVFGRTFRVTGAVAKARLYLTGLGMYAATVNGRPVGDAVLEPGQTTYSAEVDYRTYDLTRRLRSGRNVLGIETGSGAYQRVRTPGRYFFGGQLEQFVVYGEPKAIGQLEITYTDGRRERIGTDTSWRTALGPTTFSSWWSGEEYDARRSATAPGPGADLTGPDWQDASLAALSAATTPRSDTPLRADPRPPVTVAGTVRPTRITPTGTGSYLLDFGANRSGWPALRVSGPAGSTVTMTPAEVLAADGTLDVRSTGASATGRIAYRYTLAGHGVETWHPRFTYNGFRYLQVDGLPAAPTADTVTTQVVHAANRPASSFSSSSQLLNEIHAITLRSMQSNMTSVLTDCPDREKGPYTGDNLHNIDALLTDYDMSAYQPQLVRNMATAQRPAGDEFPGLIANIAPEFHRVRPVKLNFPQGVIEFLDEVNWGGAIIRIPWKLYQTYGDTRTMATYYDQMVTWLDYESANKAANNGDIPGLGDWSATDNTTPLQLPIVAGHHTAASELAMIAQVLGKPADHAKYTALAGQLAAEFSTRFRHTDAAGVFYGSDSEASNAMALDAGLVPAADRAAVLGRLVASVRRSDNHITTGSVALGPLFRALAAGGRDDVLYDMIVNPTAPGYGYFVASGRTALAESFNGGGSQNHHFLGQVDAWFISSVAGIRPATGSVGYRELEIAPAVVGDLTEARGTYQTPYGTVSSQWRTHAGRFRLEVQIPPGTTATVQVPAAPTAGVLASRGAASLGRTTTTATYRVGPGTATFQVTP
jgi:alpha-L-rhamnosidase